MHKRTLKEKRPKRAVLPVKTQPHLLFSNLKKGRRRREETRVRKSWLCRSREIQLALSSKMLSHFRSEQKPLSTHLSERAQKILDILNPTTIGLVSWEECPINSTPTVSVGWTPAKTKGLLLKVFGLKSFAKGLLSKVCSQKGLRRLLLHCQEA